VIGIYAEDVQGEQLDALDDVRLVRRSH
jgi:hypothetical protein